VAGLPRRARSYPWMRRVCALPLAAALAAGLSGCGGSSHAAGEGAVARSQSQSASTAAAGPAAPSQTRTVASTAARASTAGKAGGTSPEQAPAFRARAGRACALAEASLPRSAPRRPRTRRTAPEPAGGAVGSFIAVQRKIEALRSGHPPASLEPAVGRLVTALTHLKRLYAVPTPPRRSALNELRAASERQANELARKLGLPECASPSRGAGARGAGG
jgi:hypothetical protein